MSGFFIFSGILFIVIIILGYFLYRESKEKEFWEKEASRENALKTALEHVCNYPEVYPEELEIIEPYLEQITKEARTPEEYLSRFEEAIIALYKMKQKEEGDKG